MELSNNIDNFIIIEHYAELQDLKIKGSFLNKTIRDYPFEFIKPFKIKEALKLALMYPECMILFVDKHPWGSNLILTYDEELQAVFYHIGNGIPEGYNFQWDFYSKAELKSLGLICI